MVTSVYQIREGRNKLKRWVFLTIYVLTAGLLFFYRDFISEWLKDAGSWDQNLTVFVIAFVIALVPAIPYSIVAALVGAKYGTLLGAFINLVISGTAAILLFLLIRYTFSPEQRRKAAEMKGVSRLTSFTERNPFFAVLMARLLPFVPAQAVNIYASVTRMTFMPYLAATILGKVPFIVTVTILGDRILQSFDWKAVVQIIIIYGVFILLVSYFYKKFQLKKETG